MCGLLNPTYGRVKAAMFHNNLYRAEKKNQTVVAMIVSSPSDLLDKTHGCRGGSFLDPNFLSICTLTKHH
jgi:hypothetical protein